MARSKNNILSLNQKHCPEVWIASVTQHPTGMPRALIGIWEPRMECWATQTGTNKSIDSSYSIAVAISFLQTYLSCSVLDLSLLLFFFFFGFLLHLPFLRLTQRAKNGLVGELSVSQLPEVCFILFGSIYLCFSFHPTFSQNFLHVPTLPSVYIPASPVSTTSTQ